eukprot:1183324-Rhodomonas_salina.1
MLLKCKHNVCTRSTIQLSWQGGEEQAQENEGWTVGNAISLLRWGVLDGARETNSLAENTWGRYPQQLQVNAS